MLEPVFATALATSMLDVHVHGIACTCVAPISPDGDPSTSEPAAELKDGTGRNTGPIQQGPFRTGQVDHPTRTDSVAVTPNCEFRVAWPCRHYLRRQARNS